MFLVGGFSRLGLNVSANGDTSAASKWGAAGAAMVFLYTFVFGATWLTVPWLYPAEIFPVKCRAIGNSWGVVGWSIGCGSLTLLLPEMVKGINEKMLYVFGIVNVLTIPIVYALYPESNQRTLEEMDLLFSCDKPWAWEAEKNSKLLKEQNPRVARSGSLASANKNDTEKGAMHIDQVHVEKA